MPKAAAAYKLYILHLHELTSYSPVLPPQGPAFQVYPILSSSILLIRPLLIQSRSIYNIHSARVVRNSNTSIALAIIISSSFLLGGSIFIHQTSRQSKDRGEQTNLEVLLHVEDYNSMVGAILPGRPGNLTKEQEAKTKELWTATLGVFGIDSPIEHGINSTEKDVDQRLPEESAGLDKKKKKRMFSRKHNSEDSDGVKVETAKDSEDKYGQNKEFQHIIATQSPDDIRRAFWSMVKHDHPDGLLLRFLRARKWNVHNALAMLIATMHWRLNEMRVDEDIVKKGDFAAAADCSSSDKAIKKEALDFMAQLRLGKSFLHGTDKEGRPICFVRVRLHRQGEQSEASLERYTVYTLETARLLLASNVDTAVSRSVRKDKHLLNSPLDYCV